MEKNTVWAVVLSTLVLIVFMFIQMMFFSDVPIGNQSERETIENEQIVASSILSPADELISESESQQETITENENLAEEQFVINTNKARITFSNRGGDIIGYELIEHRDGDTGVEMADNIWSENRAFSVAFGGTENAIINEIFNVKRIDEYTIGFYKKFEIKNADNTTSSFIFAKQYTFNPDEYMFKLDISIDGDENFQGLSFNNLAYTIRTAPQIGPYYDAKNNRYEHRTFMSYTGSKKKKNILSTEQTKIYDGSYTWTGVAGKYFEILGIPVDPSSMGDVLYSTKTEVNDYSNAQVMMTRNAVTGNNSQDTYYFYVGPRTEKDLKIYNNAAENKWNLSGLKLNESMESTGILSWLEAILKWFMETFYKVIPNWGVSIILMTILIKILLFPLTKKSSLASLKMQEIQPQMQEIQTKYKDQPEKMNAEMAKLYQEKGFNPLSGCLPLLLQFPLIFAMYNLFNNYFEFRGAMFIPGWIPDLSVGDSVCTLNFNIPLLGNQIRVLPVIYVISQLLFGKFTQTSSSTGSTATQMKIMMYGMPLFFFFIFYNAPAGLLLYWTVSNILQLVQQLILNEVIKVKKAEMEKNREPEKKVFVPRKKK